MKSRLVIFSVITMLSIMCASQTFAADPPADKSCKLPGTPMDPMFEGLKGINFEYQIPSQMQVALDCHGREEECAKAAHGDHSMQVDVLKYNYKMFPEAFRPENMTKIFMAKINEKYQPFVVPDANCNRTPVKILTRKDRFKSAEQVGFLTIIVKMIVDERDDGMPANTAILEKSFYRPGRMKYTHILLNGASSGRNFIPLDLPKYELDKKLKYLTDHIGYVGIREGIIYE